MNKLCWDKLGEIGGRKKRGHCIFPFVLLELGLLRSGILGLVLYFQYQTEMFNIL